MDKQIQEIIGLHLNCLPRTMRNSDVPYQNLNLQNFKGEKYENRASRIFNRD